MLEPTPAGPSVIRITGEEKPKNPKTAAAAPQQETKKQRQNRKKAEEKKLQREQDEQERQALLEKQRRTARESRGEPARNGVSVAPAPANGAWAAHSVANGGSAPAAASTVPLLDTFEPNTASSPSATNVQTSSSAPVAVGSTIAQDIPSEEVQMEMLNELNGWAEVPSKAKKGGESAEVEDAILPKEQTRKHFCAGPRINSRISGATSRKLIAAKTAEAHYCYSRTDHLAIALRLWPLLHPALACPFESTTARASVSAPATLTMAQMRGPIAGTAGYHLGNQGPYGGAPSRTDASSDPSPLEAIRAQTSKIEDMLDTLSEPIKP
ncbi:hypothetical protein FH972_021931 [Carpinus fangiana]|uniref:Uncharacterized protein n=1 Tax=Carpinus fangiana TaxID=176857 RepID=A0A5N6KQR4_9ROSI|nr:hypothetical protein FH972_021931 [Carpinus fangiana]